MITGGEHTSLIVSENGRRRLRWLARKHPCRFGIEPTRHYWNRKDQAYEQDCKMMRSLEEMRAQFHAAITGARKPEEEKPTVLH